jgi:hypothetical protein
MPYKGIIWRNGAFAGEFGDMFIENTELEGGQTAPSIQTVIEILDPLLVSRRKDLTLFADSDIKIVKSVDSRVRYYLFGILSSLFFVVS